MNALIFLKDHTLLFLSIIGIIGLFVGSSINVIIYRLPIMLKNSWREECLQFLSRESTAAKKVFNLFLPRSHCPKCGDLITFWHNIPLFSFLFLHGKCAYCKEKISLRYPLVESICFTTSLLIAYNFGATVQTAALLPLTWTLIAAIFIDIEHQILPDNLTMPMLWTGLILNSQTIFVTPKNAILGAVFGYLSLWTIAYVFKLIRKIEGMGHGDFKLMALFGAWFGWQILPFTIFCASLIGSMIGIFLIIFKKQSYAKPIPFGPFIAIAGWGAALFFQPNDIIEQYLKSLGFIGLLI